MPDPRQAPTAVPTLGVLELSSVAKGWKVCDTMLKKADVRILRALPVGSGKFLITFTGDEASLQEAVAAGQAEADDHLVGLCCIPNIDRQVVEVLGRRTPLWAPLDAFGVLEVTSLSTLIRAADAAVKTAAVRLLELTFEADLGGKGFATFTGSLGDVQAALEAAQLHARAAGALVHLEVVPSPHGDLGSVLVGR